jgi:carbon storage regulator CsrA
MLVLSRKLNEQIELIDDHGNLLGSIMVVKIQGNRIALGITAPAKVKVIRSEVKNKRAS